MTPKKPDVTSHVGLFKQWHNAQEEEHEIMSPQKAWGESKRPLSDIMKDLLVSPARPRDFSSHRSHDNYEECMLQNEISRKIRYSVYRGKYQPILSYPFK